MTTFIMSERRELARTHGVCPSCRFRYRLLRGSDILPGHWVYPSLPDFSGTAMECPGSGEREVAHAMS